jgi:very-short-patch-repair endonuclease
MGMVLKLSVDLRAMPIDVRLPGTYRHPQCRNRPAESGHDGAMSPSLEQLVLERHGVVLRHELYALGINPRDLYRQIHAGLWRQSGRAVLVHHSAAQGLLTDTLVAARRNPDGILTGTSAALLRPHPAWSGLNLQAAPAMIIAPPHRRGPWLTVQHPGAAFDVISGLRVCDQQGALVDVLRFLDWSQAAAVAGAANQLGLTTNELLEASIRRLAGHPGTGQLRVLVNAMRRGAESGPEIDLHSALLRARIQGWVANPTIVIGDRRYRPDIAFLSRRLAIEYDGLDVHATREAFFRDRERDIDFQLAGWLVLRLTKRTLYEPARMGAFLSGLRRCLDARRAA